MKFIFVSSLCLFFLMNGLFADQNEQPEPPEEIFKGNKTLGIKSNHTICILLSFNRTIIEVSSVKDEPKKKVYLENTYELSDSEVVLEKSYCTFNNSQRLALKFNDGNVVTFDFKQNQGPNTYTLSQLTLELQNSTQLENIENSTTTSVIERTMPSPDVKTNKKPISRGYSYGCKARVAYKFDLASKNDTQEFRVKIQGFKFWAFRKYNITIKDFVGTEKISCDVSNKKSKPGNDIIPIAVGGVLTGCLVISLIGYLVIRARKG